MRVVAHALSHHMEVHFSADTQAKLEQFAATAGKDPAQLVEETVTRLVERRAEFLAGVEEGITAADQGDLIDHEEVLYRIGRLFRS